MNKKIVISVLLSTALLTGLVVNTYASNTLTGSTQNKKEFKVSVNKGKSGSGVLNNMGKMDSSMRFGKRMGKGENRHFGAINKLTDAEKESLKTMTDEQKNAFFEKKKAENESKRDSHEAVIDKLINGVVLTDADKVILEEIKIDRAEKKAKRLEMKTKMEEIKVILEKSKNGTVLTSDEQTKLNEFQSTHNKKGKGKNRGFGKMWK